MYTPPVFAHFVVDTQNREIHITPSEEGNISVLVRFPLTLAYANELAKRSLGAPFSAPFMTTQMVRGGTYYQLDTQKISAEPEEFVGFLLRDFEFSFQGVAVTPTSAEFIFIDTHENERENANIKPGLEVTKMLMQNTAKNTADSPYISDTLIVISFELPDIDLTDSLKITLNSAVFPIPEGKYFETRISDHRSNPPQLFISKGASFDPVTLSGSNLKSFFHFVKQGVQHILSGYDHVLFVLCLVIAATNIRLLFFSITGFTLGHSVTLLMGVFGYIPQGAWFIPFIELTIALSIFLMATLILLRKTGKLGFWVAGSIGLLHGFGFSFLLSEIVGGSGKSLLIALGGFNIGVEIGQLLIVSIAFLLLFFVNKLSPKLSYFLRYSIASFAGLVAVIWVVQRLELLIINN